MRPWSHGHFSLKIYLSKAKRPREENIYDEEKRIQCEQRAKTFLKWFSSNPNNFFNDKVFVFLYVLFEM